MLLVGSFDSVSSPLPSGSEVEEVIGRSMVVDKMLGTGTVSMDEMSLGRIDVRVTTSVGISSTNGRMLEVWIDTNIDDSLVRAEVSDVA